MLPQQATEEIPSEFLRIPICLWKLDWAAGRQPLVSSLPYLCPHRSIPCQVSCLWPQGFGYLGERPKPRREAAPGIPVQAEELPGLPPGDKQALKAEIDEWFCSLLLESWLWFTYCFPFAKTWVIHLLKYSFISASWKEHCKWKCKLLRDGSLLSSHLPAESCVLTITKFTLQICQVAGHLLFTVWKSNEPAVRPFLLEPFSNPPADRERSGGGFESPPVHWHDEYGTDSVCSVPHQTAAAFCHTRLPKCSLLWVSELF